MDITLEQVKEIVEEFKRITKKECYKLSVSNEKASITDTKLSGLPYMPEGDEFPQDEEGNDMSLLAQINFEDIKLENYPEKGILQLFIATDGSWPTPYKVRYYEDISRPARTDLEFTPMDDFVYEEVKLNLEKSEGYMPVNDFRFNDMFEDVVEEIVGERIEFFDLAEEFEGEYDLYDALYADNGNIGGYADFTQNDPRDGDIDEDYTECLIKIDSNLDSRKVMIGDSGIAWLLMTEEDLINKNFENASFDWDCM